MRFAAVWAAFLAAIFSTRFDFQLIAKLKINMS